MGQSVPPGGAPPTGAPGMPAGGFPMLPPGGMGGGFGPMPPPGPPGMPAGLPSQPPQVPLNAPGTGVQMRPQLPIGEAQARAYRGPAGAQFGAAPGGSGLMPWLKQGTAAGAGAGGGGAGVDSNAWYSDELNRQQELAKSQIDARNAAMSRASETSSHTGPYPRYFFEDTAAGDLERQKIQAEMLRNTDPGLIARYGPESVLEYSRPNSRARGSTGGGD
jgi:hypothetical protein